MGNHRIAALSAALTIAILFAESPPTDAGASTITYDAIFDLTGGETCDAEVPIRNNGPNDLGVGNSTLDIQNALTNLAEALVSGSVPDVQDADPFISNNAQAVLENLSAVPPNCANALREIPVW
jgi:hypothetical protein